MQTLMRFVVALVIVLLLLVVVLPLWLVSMLIEKDPEYEPETRATPPASARVKLPRLPRLGPP